MVVVVVVVVVLVMVLLLLIKLLLELWVMGAEALDTAERDVNELDEVAGRTAVGAGDDVWWCE